MELTNCLLAIVPDPRYFGEASFSFISLLVVYLKDLGMNPLGTLRRMSSFARAPSFTLWMAYLYSLESQKLADVVIEIGPLSSECFESSRGIVLLVYYLHVCNSSREIVLGCGLGQGTEDFKLENKSFLTISSFLRFSVGSSFIYGFALKTVTSS